MGGFFDQVASFLNHPLTLALGGFALFCLLVLWALNNVRPGKPRPFAPTDTPWLNAVFAAAIGLSPILAILFVAVLAMLVMVGWHIFASNMIADDPDNLRWYVLSFVALLTALGGIIGAPLAVIRIWNSERQTSTQEEALFNEKINAAALGLAARRQVTRVVGHGDDEKVLTEWQDDLVSRNAAIDQLEGLVHERTEAADRIASLLSVYVVELSAEHPPRKPPEGASPKDLRVWTWGLLQKNFDKRTDMERAVQTLGRLQKIEGVTLQKGRIDLRRANLQGFDLHNLIFSDARLNDVHLEGAPLVGAYLERAILVDAHLEGAYIVGAQFEGANFWNANLEGVVLIDTDLDKKTSFEDATLKNAQIRDMSWKSVDISQLQINSMFGDASVTLPTNLTRPNHWPDTDLGPQEFHDEYQDWLTNPASYLPPQNRS